MKQNNFFVDVNECETNSSVCPQLCINTNGSFKCKCNQGYLDVFGDGKNCTGN